MQTYDAIMIVEGVREPADPQDYIDAWQHLIDNGLHVNSWREHAADTLIDQGLCISPDHPADNRVMHQCQRCGDCYRGDPYDPETCPTCGYTSWAQ